jgi:N-acetylglucosamine-6-sulfatase
MTRSMKVYAAAAAVVLSLGSSSLVHAPKAQALPTQPNILFLLVDDMRKDELSPLVFRNDGTWLNFTSAAVEVPMCCPSRASILTGRYSSEVGVRTNTEGPNLDDSRTIATVMKAAGYRTGLAGKYLNDFPWTLPDTYVPPGWDYWRADGSAAKAAESQGYYTADYLTVAAKNFINATPAGRPFFLYLAYNQPHLPATPPKRYATAPVTLAPWPPNFNEADVSDKPPEIRALPLADQTTIDRWTQERTSKLRSLMAVNESVKAVLGHLQQKGLLESTIVFFTSDNGYGFGSHRVESKAYPYEELVTMPFYVRMPGRSMASVPSQVSLLDLAPTFAGFAGATMPLARGVSLKNVISDPQATLTRTWVFMEGPRRANSWQGVKSRTAKYIVYAKGFKEYYDLASDPYELTNRASDPAYANRVSAAQAALTALRP